MVIGYIVGTTFTCVDKGLKSLIAPTNGRFGFERNLCRVYVRHTEVRSDPLPLTSRNFLRILPLPCIYQVN